jgi:hypothetical protein
MTYITDAANEVAERAQTTGGTIREAFNGTPLVAYYGDSGALVALRWHYERLLYQLANGIITLNDVTLERAGPEYDEAHLREAEVGAR